MQHVNTVFQNINCFFKLVAKNIVRAFSLNSQNSVNMTITQVDCETILTVSKRLHWCFTCQWVGAQTCGGEQNKLFHTYQKGEHPLMPYINLHTNIIRK